jgi:ribose-phosphate pyrophosphokinase
MAIKGTTYVGSTHTTQIDFPNEGPFFPKSFKFNGGEVQVSLEEFEYEVNINSRATITARIHNSDDLMELIMVTDAVRRLSPLIQMTLVLPYLPYSRQDRVANVGEALSAAVFARMINALNFKKVFTYDAHSDVSVACLDNCESYPMNMWLDDNSDLMNDFANIDHREDRYVLVAPDAGAMKKTLALAKHYGGLQIINCAKQRDTETGEITGTYVNWGYSMRNMNLLIVDDICDGGRTFIEIAKAVQRFKPNRIELAVTHGIFSKGLTPLLDSGISKVYTTDSFDQPHVGMKVVTTL